MLILWFILTKLLLWDILFKLHGKDSALRISASRTSAFFANNSSTSPDFGMRLSYSWSSILSKISEWNDNTNGDIYRLVIIGRHGEGFHNIAENKYGTRSWEDKWSKLNGDGVLTWGPDANLTTIGEQQAKLVQRLWSSQKDLPVPVIKYSSPLSRALKTAAIAFDEFTSNSSLIVLEDLRETIGVHTCDRRSSLSQTLARFPRITFEPYASEEDVLWRPDSREDDKHTQDRAKSALQHIMRFECQAAKQQTPEFPQVVSAERVLSVTTHSGLIRGLLTELELPSIRVKTGAIITLILHTSCANGPYA